MNGTATEKLFYKDVYGAYIKEFDAAVVSCEKNGDRWNVILDRTCFYPEGGGQPADHGKISGASVIDVRETCGEIVHVTDAEFKAGDQVHGIIDWERRFDHMQQHSGEHIISGMLCSAFRCNNVGFHMGSEIIQIDYDTDISREAVLEIERKANRYIWENHSLNILWPSKNELDAITYRSKKELTGDVRITEWPGADICACCGTHVKTSAEVGLIKTLSVQKIKNGVRIELLCGRRAFDYLSEIWDQNLAISQALSARPLGTADAVDRLKQDNFRIRYDKNVLQEKVFAHIAQEYAGADDPVIFTEPMDSESVRKLCDMVALGAHGRICVFSGNDRNYKYAVIHKNTDIKSFVNEMNRNLGGRGGGKNGFAQGNMTSNKDEIIKYLSNMTKYC